MAVLKKLNGSTPGEIVQLKDEETIIGRLQDVCSVVLDLQGVSRRHASIRRVGADYYLTDLRSRNKTYLNDREIPPDEPQPLHPGDRIVICDVEMVFYPALPPPPELMDPDPAPDPGIDLEKDPSTICTLDASRSDAVAVAVKPELKLKAILDITRNLSSSLELEQVVPKILDSLLEIFPQAERVFLVLLKDPDGKRSLRRPFHKNRPTRRAGSRVPLGRPSDEATPRISETILSAVLNQKKAVLSRDATSDANLPTSASIADLRIRSFMCSPLLAADGQALGILQLDTTDRQEFRQDDLEVLSAVASQAAFAVQNASMHERLIHRERIERDLRLAEQVQRRFLPQSVPKVAGYEFFAFYQPAYNVGGDYYDFVMLPGDRVAVALGDVAGKGIAAALMMAKFSGDTRLCILTDNEPGRATGKLNGLLCDAGLEERFITMCLGILDLNGSTFAFSSAGHLPVLLRRADGRVEEVGSAIRGFPLGIMPDLVYEQLGTQLAPGDVVVIYSDGITDAQNASEKHYDTDENPRLRKRLAVSPGSPEAVGRSIIQDIREFSAGKQQFDDMTLVCFGPVAR
jgi:serine phosphatase RsbU (regulator of sigma subunit)